MLSVDPASLCPPTELVLSQHDVHVWQVNLNVPTPQHRSLETLLSPDECQRAERYRFDRDRNWFVVARATLRTILSEYLGTDPRELQFATGSHGKPSLATTSVGGMVQFNLSHSHGKALYAIALGREVGIDLECIRPVEADKLAQRFFSDREYQTLASLSPEQQQRQFFQYWTCKEAYLKATGDGLTQLQQVEIALDPPRIHSIDDNPFLASRWSLQPLDCGSDYAAALVVEGRGMRLSVGRWEG